ncbi:MAG: hypothetical protein LUC88_00240 [Prevotella sp.]|nr:hypothetical protein [Prevotella sp.]
MITLTTTLPDKCFSCTLPEITFTADQESAQVIIKIEGEEIFNETLYTDDDGSITLSDLADLIQPYAKEQLVVLAEINIIENDEDGNPQASVSLSTTVVYCTADFGDTSADDFLDSHFLSILLGKKITAIGRLEYLHYLGTDVATVTAYFADGSIETDLTPDVVGGNSKYTTIDVSPSLFNVDDRTLIGYVVKAGNRSQEYIMDLRNPDCAPILVFDNSFGCQELVYCTGTHTVSPQFTRSSAFIKGLLKNYKIEESREFKADTGVLNTAMANWLDDLFRSSYVEIVNFYNNVATVGKEVVITDSKSEYSNEAETQPRFTFTYKYAQRNHNVVQLAREGRIFDNTFDFTFN